MTPLIASILVSVTVNSSDDVHEFEEPVNLSLPQQEQPTEDTDDDGEESAALVAEGDEPQQEVAKEPHAEKNPETFIGRTNNVTLHFASSITADNPWTDLNVTYRRSFGHFEPVAIFSHHYSSAPNSSMTVRQFGAGLRLNTVPNAPGNSFIPFVQVVALGGSVKSRIDAEDDTSITSRDNYTIGGVTSLMIGVSLYPVRESFALQAAVEMQQGKYAVDEQAISIGYTFSFDGIPFLVGK